MESLLILIPIALVFVIIAIAIFFWAVKSGQYDDLNTEARRILFDEDRPPAGEEGKTDANKKSAVTGESGDCND